MKTDNFNKFFNKKNNAAVKEGFRQEKKAAKKERKAAIERHFEDRRKARTQPPTSGKPTRSQPTPAAHKLRTPSQSAPFRNPRTASQSAPFRNPRTSSHSAPARTAQPPNRNPRTAAKPAPTRSPRAVQPPPHHPRPIAQPIPAPSKKTASGISITPTKTAKTSIPAKPGAPPKSITPNPKSSAPKSSSPTAKPSKSPSPKSSTASTPSHNLPLNKYIAHSGICSRRDAADLVRQGKVTVNGQLITEPGTKVLPTDIVKVHNKKVTISHNHVYILLNKPKDYLTTNEDPQGRRTVLELIRSATTERVFPIGRLDRNTSGVLLFTNDGDLAQKLAHPKHQIRKIYHVTLDKPLTKADFEKIAAGAITLEDGPASVDDLAYADPKDKSQIGLEIHSGRNRIVRRIFEHLGYDVRGLDRVMYAGLTKKNVQRGHWRLLNEKEIRILKYLNNSK